MFFFFKQKTAYEMRISDWMSDVCSSDLFWPTAASGGVRVAIIVGSLVFLVAVNVVGVRAAARTGVFLAIAKVLPLLMFLGIGAMYVDMSLATPLAGPIPLDDLGRAALLPLFAYA